MTIELSRYSFETLREDRESAFCRGRRDDGELPTILLVGPVSEYHTSGSFKQLEHEYALRDELDSDWAARPLTMARRESRTMLVLEDPGGEPLDRLLGEPMKLSRFLRFAAGLAAALGKLHKRGLIHKDIKPANILVDSSTGAVWFTGFGIAARFPRERQSPEPPEVIAGTLAYMAPEQTGRMNRSIDSRSDLYSLGVTFYEMLSGVLPFNASDPMEWVHCHVARQPPRLTERLERIPEPISAIVSKLLAKTAEERYQTAAGLEADLRKCLTEWESLGQIEPFPLGTHDIPDRLLIPEKLYGRDAEREVLLTAFERVVASGTPELVLVSGYSGIGKSSVVNELHKVIVRPRGIFISGKFDQHKRDIPYATLGQSFQGLVRQILSKSEAEVSGWREAIVEAVGREGQLIVNLIPELELVIGKQSPVLEIPPQEAQNRFDTVLRRFIGAFARKEHPLVLFVDDLQWMDPASLKLLEQLVTHPDIRHLLLIGAYRDNEVNPYHPLTLTLDSIRKTEAIVHEIVLQPLSLADVNQLLRDALRCEPVHAQRLAELVHEKTGGNPFFANQFLTTLAEEHLLEFDPAETGWRWDLNRIRAKGFTDNVAELMVAKLKRLPDVTQEALRQLASLGNSAEITTFWIVQGKSGKEPHSDLWEAIRGGFVLRQGESYGFLHDRVQEAAYALIPEESRAQFHLNIGRLMIAKMTAEQMAEKIFNIVNQLNSGLALISDLDEKDRVARLNLDAGRKAKASTAYASACTYLSLGMELLGAEAWKRRYELAFGLWIERAECEFLSANFEEADRLILELLRRAKSKIDRAAAYRLKVLLHLMQADNPKAVRSALEGLRMFGIEMHANPTREHVQLEYERIWLNLGERSIESLIDLQLMTDPEMRAAMSLLSVLIRSAYFTDSNLHRLLVCHMVNLTLSYGTTDASTDGYAWFAVILGPVFRRYDDGHRIARLAIDLVEKHEIAWRAGAYVAMQMAVLWTRPIQVALDSLQTAFRAAIDSGDVVFACYSLEHTVTDLLTRGDHLDQVWLESVKGLAFALKAKFRHVADIILSIQLFVQNMRGQHPSSSTFDETWVDEQALEARLAEGGLPIVVCWYWILKLRTRFMAGDYEAAIDAARRAKPLLWSSECHIQLVDYHYHGALALAAVYAGASPDRQGSVREELAANLEPLHEWAENCSENFLDKYALVSAEIARIEGRDLDAMGLYEKAIRAAREHGFVQNEGIGNELAARFYLDRSYETIGYAYLREARYCFLRWGALGKVKQLEQRYPAIAEQESRRPTTTIGTPVEQLDLGTVMKASQAVAGEIVLEKFIETLMVIALEHAGAERGLLILPHGEEHRIEAEARTGRDGVEVNLRQAVVTSSELPESLLRYVIRTRESVILNDASVENLFSEDQYVRRRRPRSVLCLPLVKQAKLVGALYLENNLAPRVFTPNRFAMLELLASQAAISLDHAQLYADLARLNAELTQENSDRRKAEEALRASEERWRKLFENSSAGIALNAPDGRFMVANLALQKMLGYTEEELQKLTPLELTHEEDRAATEARIAEAYEGQRRVHRFEKRYLRKDGGVIWVDASGVLVPATGSTPAFFAGVFVDITERKRSEEALRESEQQLQDVVDNTTAVIFVKDLQLRYVLVNREYERLFHVERNQIRGKTDFDVHPHDIAEAVRANDRHVIEAGEPIQFNETVPSDGCERLYVCSKFLLRDRTGKPYAVCGIATDITALKRAEEMQAAMAREREIFAKQRATELAKANEALRGCLDALASVPQLDDFLGQVMGAITRQLDAVSSSLRTFSLEQNTLTVQLVFQGGRVMSPAEARYPETARSLSPAEHLDQPTTVIHILDPHSPIPEAQRSYLLGLGIKTLLIIPLSSGGQVNGRLGFRFTEERTFDPEELEIARALATQASLAIQLTRLAKTARQSAVLEERNRLAAEIHDTLAQSFTGISMQLELVQEEMVGKEGALLGHIRHAYETAKFGLAEARRSVHSLRSSVPRESGFVATLRGLVEHSNLAGRLRCDFRYNRIPEERLPATVQHHLLRIAQEAISNAVRHAKPTAVTVTLRWDPPNLILQVKDNGSGIPKARLEKSDGVGLDSMRERAAQMDAKLEIQTAAGQGTSIIVTVPIT